RGADRVPLRVPVERLPVAVLLGVAVPRVDLDEPLLLRVVLGGRELLVERRAGRRVESPRRAVRDDERVEAPLRELLEQLLRRLRALRAADGKLARVDAGGTERRREELLLELLEVEVALAVRPVVERELEPLPERLAGPERADQLLVERADRPARHLVVGRVAEDHVLVAVVLVRRRADLGPFPAEERHEVRILRVAGDRVALADRVLRLLPVLRRDGFGVIRD